MTGSTVWSRTRDGAAHGDDDALERLVREHYDRVYRYGRRVCRDDFDADDAVQEAFSKLSRRGDLAADPGVVSWLLTVVKNTCRQLLRPFARARRNLGERVEAEAVPSPVLDPEAALDRWRLVEAVHRAIARLEPEFREVLVLRDLEGMRGDEVCTALGLGEAAMKSRLHRARVRLRELIAKDPATMQEVDACSPVVH